MGTEGGDKCVDNVDKLRKKWWGGEKGTNPEEVCNTTGRQRGQGNFELAANFGYSSRGSADPRESLRKRRISKLALSAHLQDLPLAAPSGCNATKCCRLRGVADLFRVLAFAWGRVVKRDCFRILVFMWGRGEVDCGWKEEV
ncbi:hypothetical protein DW266_06940 [Blautia sp. AM22-22LB]|nr:hypothetical protein DW266_06940 [Blautia sp. AM22-22LB]